MGLSEVAVRLLKRVPGSQLPTPRCELHNCKCHGSSFTWRSDQHRFIWFETPKCASTTLKHALPTIERFAYPFQHTEHLTFSVVRNPWDRMVSNYSMFVQKEDPMRKRQIEDLFCRPRSGLSFDQFVELASTIRNHHWEECMAFLPQAEGGHPDVDVLLRLETLNQDIRVLERRLGISINLPHKNATSHTAYQRYYSDWSRKKVAEMFSRDIECLDYSF